MNVGQAVLDALESLSANKLRASLTILGIVIGVAAVIAMVSVGRGAQSTITIDQRHWYQPGVRVPRRFTGCAQPQTHHPRGC